MKAIMFPKATLFVLILTGVTAATKHFLDCPGIRPSYLTRCCKNEPQLPKNCEFFSRGRASGFTNTILLPQCPKDMGVRFLLYTRSNKYSFEVIKVSDKSIGQSHFRPSRPIKILVHGFSGKAPEKWSLDMKNAILNKEDANVILVDWQGGAKLTFLINLQAVANVRSVGAMVAKLVQVLVSQHGASFKNVHLIGHSLGAHLSGMAGKEIKRLTGQQVGRISGLDPAGPGFETWKTHIRLDRDDAIFVDVIHTDAEPLLQSGFGIRRQIGDVDFWPNGGEHQPSCPPEIWLFTLFFVKDGQSIGFCSHDRVLDYFTSSITKCDYNAGRGCKMGYHASRKYCQGNKHLKTKDKKAPYC